MSHTTAGVDIPDGPIAQAAADQIRVTESALMFHHAYRAFLFAVLTGHRQHLKFDPEMLFVAMMFHNVGLGAIYRTSINRFEIDSANEARDFLRQNAAADHAAAEVWTAIALHTTPGIPEHMSPLVALTSAGVQMDLRGARYDDFTAEQREDVLQAFPRESGFKKKIIQAYARGMEHRPETTFGTVNADVLDRWDPNYRRLNFCGLVLGSEWQN
ncbi:hypothetical protein P3T18_000007 [Paraburkholderia sp. GAS199]|uniref:phosphohydrolase n=1 Tax=Paraburkholderia sp. GAS199 TaxID=3035126 RepID=UPI003D19CD5C